MIVSWPWKLKVQNCSCQDQRKVFVLWTSKNFKNISSACKGQITHFKTSLGEHFIHSEKCLTWERRTEEEAIPVSVGYWINLKNATKLRDDAFLQKGYFLKLIFSFGFVLKPILHFWQGAGYAGNWVLIFFLKVLKTFTVIINIFHKTGKVLMIPTGYMMILQFFNFSLVSPYFCLLQNFQICLRHHRLPWICYFFVYFSDLFLYGQEQHFSQGILHLFDSWLFNTFYYCGRITLLQTSAPFGLLCKVCKDNIFPLWFI